MLRDGVLAAEYAYDRAGRRVTVRCEATGMEPQAYAYDGDLLLRAGGESFVWAGDGTLARMVSPRGETRFLYEPGGGLGRVDLPDGRTITYILGEHGQPLEKFVDGRRVERFRWRDSMRLAAYRDVERGVSMRFHYTEGRLPHSVAVTDARSERTYALGCDQVGTLKAVADEHGDLIQVIHYDSFGGMLRIEGDAGLFIPMGFAGGLRDRHTGLVRFVHRDYDPRTGRFTARDPLGDTGGDHDLYEYCVDDPVNMVDPWGLKRNWYKDWLEHSEAGDEEAGGQKRNWHKDWLASQRQGVDYELVSGDEDAARKAGLKAKGCYWIVTPKPTACDKCQEYLGKIFFKKPKRPHPNCKCKITRVVVMQKKCPRFITGELQGQKDHEYHKFSAVGRIRISADGAGPALNAGVWFMTNNDGDHVIWTPPFGGNSFFIGRPSDKLLDWEVHVMLDGADNCTSTYEIHYTTLE